MSKPKFTRSRLVSYLVEQAKDRITMYFLRAAVVIATVMFAYAYLTLI